MTTMFPDWFVSFYRDVANKAMQEAGIDPKSIQFLNDSDFTAESVTIYAQRGDNILAKVKLDMNTVENRDEDTIRKTALEHVEKIKASAGAGA